MPDKGKLVFSIVFFVLLLLQAKGHASTLGDKIVGNVYGTVIDAGHHQYADSIAITKDTVTSTTTSTTSTTITSSSSTTTRITTTTTTTSSTISTTSTTSTVTTTTCATYCWDVDGDGYGDPKTLMGFCGTIPQRWVLDCSDCDDTDPSINPEAEEICDNGVDEDCDKLEGCNDPDCDCDPGCKTSIGCTDTTYLKGSSYIKFNHKARKSSKDKALLRLCIDECFCEALKKGVEEIVLWLDECDQITIPGSILKSNKDKTMFTAKSSTYKLIVNCKKGWLKLLLKNVDLKVCASNPVKTCISLDDDPCLCTEEEFNEHRDKKERLKKLSLTVRGRCSP